MTGYREAQIKKGCRQVGKRHFYVENTCNSVKGVYSYSTLIGYLRGDDFIEWGYQRYSTTTSKQISQFTHENRLNRIHVDSEDEAVKKINQLATKGGN